MAEYIEREAAKEYLFRSIGADPEGICRNCTNDEHNCQYNREWTLMDFCEKIENLGYVPAADVAPVRHGRWKGAGMGDYYCSLCQKLANPRTNYCPNCGARMDGGDGS